ncbi:uncharacterized protein LOC130674159 [Microplitis mediator]|uniref:uncharacterized protein LOC130674159 n=1 Tax=Microplitis mediator TaxID=375433 RepID=UPI0025579B93|nr:uncharacterized protein LOC130674159 [Microplitis mediator]
MPSKKLPKIKIIDVMEEILDIEENEEIIEMIKRQNDIGKIDNTKVDVIKRSRIKIKAVCNRRTGGTLMYIRQDIKYEELNKVINDGKEEKNLWMCNIRLKNRSKELIISCVYHSPSQSHGQFIDRLNQEVENLIDKGTIIIMGDFNINVDMESQYSKKFIRLMKSLGFKQRVKNHTRITKDSKTIIDLVFSCEEVKREVLESSRITDHCIVEIGSPIVDYKMDIKDRVLIKKYYNNVDEVKLASFMKEEYASWCASERSNRNDVNEHTRSLTRIIVDSIDRHVPMKQIIIPAKWKNKQWMNAEIKKLMYQRDEAYKEAKEESDELLWSRYKELRNMVVDEIRKAKKNFYAHLIDKNKTDSRKMWTNLKALIGNKNKRMQRNEISFDNECCDNAIIIADKFNQYFISSVENIVEEIDKTVTEPDELSLIGIKTILNKLGTTNEEELDKIIKNFDTNKEKNNLVSPEALVKVWDINKQIISELINSSLRLSEVPEDWKNSTIYPIAKATGTIKAEEYRPIDTLPELETILEKVVKNRLDEHVEVNGILNEEQSGFRENHSCETVIQKIMSEWRKELDNGNMIGVVLIDRD